MADFSRVDDGMASLNVSGNKENVFDKFKKSNATSSAERMKECFQHFDKDKDGKLSKAEFCHMLKHLFCRKGKPYKLTKKNEEEIFKLLDENQEGFLTVEKFKMCWYHWFKQILDPVSALVVVDVQNDFVDGTLAIRDCPAEEEGADVVPVINHMIDSCHFDIVVYSLDWHPKNHISFVENVFDRKLHHSSKISSDKATIRDTVVFDGSPTVEQKLWPMHCVQGSWGAELHPDLKVARKHVMVKKGINPDVDSYSAFWDNNKLSQTNLVSELTKLGVTDVYACGLAYDFCVGSTALHSIEHGFRTTVVEDACRGVAVDTIEKMKNKLKSGGAVLCNSSEVPDMLNAVDRRPEHGYQAAHNVAMARRLVNEKCNGQTKK